MEITEEPFGTLKDGRQAHLYTIANDHGAKLKVTDFGARVVALLVPDKDGQPLDVILGYDDIDSYERDTKYMGAIAGRCANRIARGELLVGTKSFALEKNDHGRNHLHGGTTSGFDKKLWQGEITKQGLGLTYVSPDGEGNYPGELTAKVTYALSNANEFIIRYEASATKDTVVNLSNHSYFNLDGAGTGPALDEKVKLFSSAYTPTDEYSIPDGRVLLVEGTPMDLREGWPIGRQIDAEFSQLRWAGGYDHNWMIDEQPCVEEAKANGLGQDASCPVDYAKPHMKKAAYAEAYETGVTMTVYTTSPGLQFYTGNYLDAVLRGKGGAVYGPRAGFAMETQFPPDAVHNANFPQPFLKKGNVWQSVTVYAFGVKK